MLAIGKSPKLRAVSPERVRILAPEEILRLSATHSLPAQWRMRPVGEGVFADSESLLTMERCAPVKGQLVCLESAGRLTFRRVLDVRKNALVVRCDVAPFAESWDGAVVGCARLRAIDRVACVDPSLFTRASWRASLASTFALSMRRKLVKPRQVAFTTRALEQEEWPSVRAFWFATCGTELTVPAQANQHVVGLFVGTRLVGANIHLVQGATSYSAFTLVDKRYRGCGGGRKMLDHAVVLARAQGLQNIYVHIHVRNLPSIAAYGGAGFRRTRWWADAADPLASAERQWLIFELDLREPSAPAARE
jgi:ribosomal protein S18 acetylase RimI-like enzyme